MANKYEARGAQSAPQRMWVRTLSAALMVTMLVGAGASGEAPEARRTKRDAGLQLKRMARQRQRERWDQCATYSHPDRMVGVGAIPTLRVARPRKPGGQSQDGNNDHEQGLDETQRLGDPDHWRR